MDRRLQLVRQFEECAEQQRRFGSIAAELLRADLSLLAEWYQQECRRVGELMHQAIDELEAMDRASKVAA